MPTCLNSEKIVNSADDNINCGGVASLCSQVVLELCEENQAECRVNSDVPESRVFTCSRSR